MIEILLILAGGFTAGYFTKRSNFISKASNKLLSWTIYLLLFSFGLNIGANEDLFTNFPLLGFTSVILAIGGVLGSVIFAWFFNKIGLSRQNEK